MAGGKHTAPTRNHISAPMQILQKEIKGTCLDYGCGRGFDCDFFGFDGYDPNWRDNPLDKKYDTVFCNFVLNIMSEEEQNDTINTIYNLLNEGGVAYFAVRRDLKEDKVVGDHVQRLVYLDLPVYREVKGRFIIYKLEKKEL